MSSSAVVKNYLQLPLGALEYEVFGIPYLDVQQRILAFKEMFRGTLSRTAVYPREVVKLALDLNASAVILAHNHPSGNSDPSRADEFLKASLKAAMAMVDTRVLDHIIVWATDQVSFADRGLL